MVDDTQSAKDLWKELKRIFNTSSQQEIKNLHTRLNTILFDK